VNCKSRVQNPSRKFAICHSPSLFQCISSLRLLSCTIRPHRFLSIFTTATMSKRITRRTKIFLAADVEEKTREGKCWVTKDGRVYDVTPFACDHPGGEELVLAYAGKDVGEIMADADEHAHSDSAYELLSEYQIGVIGREAKICDEDAKLDDDDFYPEETAVADDYKAHQFLDLDRPLFMQVFNASFSKNFYLQQVHQPRHLAEPARLFGPDYLEMFTRTKWWVIPLIWLPITAALFARSVAQQQPQLSSNPLEWTYGSTAIARTAACFVLGNFAWTIIEYGMHRFLFHVDDYLPDHPVFLTLHFLLHGEFVLAAP
jgi:cytochrome b involved in lipid metabolism